jgi:hypothetical protein
MDETRDEPRRSTPTAGDVGFRYQDRRIQAREIGGEAARLARLVGGTRGQALSCAARGDSNRLACEQLGMGREELDEMLGAGDGHRLAGS